MSEKLLNEHICLKEYISEKDYDELAELSNLCYLNDSINLKLELEYKLDLYKNQNKSYNKINEFFYYSNENLISYLGISSFNDNVAEINGMTHPDWRRKGIFKKMIQFAINECANRNFSKILLLSDFKSVSGINFIESIGGKYDFSEYRMKLNEKISLNEIGPVSLRKAEKSDNREIAKQNEIFFGGGDESDIFNQITYMIELNETTIGKIKVEFNHGSAFIFGFGILPDYRGKGYGKAALKQTISLIQEKSISEIELDVETKNDRALNLYTSCGFEKKSAMNYYNI